MLCPYVVIVEHGIGGSKDLPISAELTIAGATAALAVSFIILALAWRTSRFDGPGTGAPVPRWLEELLGSRTFATSLRAAGFLFFGYVAFAALAGPDVVINPVFGVVYVWLWVGIVPASLLFGPVYLALSPVRTMHLALCKAVGRDPEQGYVNLPGGVGVWPASLGLFAFVWLELVSRGGTSLGPLRVWMGVYIAVGLVGAAVFGSPWLAAADPFEVYSTLVGHLALIGRRPDGSLVWRSPLANLSRVPATPGLVAVIAVLFGSTAFDSFKDSAAWVGFAQSLAVDRQLVNSVALVTFCAAVGLSFAVATMLTGTHAGSPRTRAPAQFAHSVVPIIVGYITAHYLSYLVVVGQVTLAELSDPLARGDDLFGTAGIGINYWIVVHPAALAHLKVIAVIGGHVLGVVSAHDRAVAVLPRRHQLTGQLPLLALMVFFTVAGLLLLFGA